MVLTIALVVLAVLLHTPWWSMIPVFFAFIAAFSHLASGYLSKMSRQAAGKLNLISFICICLAVVALIVVYFSANSGMW